MGLGVGWVGWSFALYPAAGEGGGCRVGRARLVEPASWSADPERAAAEAARRARAKIRRYCSANRLNREGFQNRVHAAAWYSWMSPPRRSWRSIVFADSWVCLSLPAGASRASARCGRSRL
jgi:hypothetical protein